MTGKAEQWPCCVLGPGPGSWKIKVPCSYVVFNKPVLIKLIPSQASMGVLPPVDGEEPSTDTKGSSLPFSFWMQLPTLPSQLTAAHGYSPTPIPARGLSWQLLKAPRQREGGWQPFPKHNLSQIQTKHPHCQHGWDSTDDGPKSDPRNCKGSEPGESHGNPVPWTPREGKTNWEILQRSICHSNAQKLPGNLTEHPDRKHVPGGTGTAWLGGQSSGDGTWEG